MENDRFKLIYKKKNYNLVLMFESSVRDDGDLFEDDVDIKDRRLLLLLEFWASESLLLYLNWALCNSCCMLLSSLLLLEFAFVKFNSFNIFVVVVFLYKLV